MELLSNGAPRVLAYVAALNRGGHQPVREDVEAYALNPDRTALGKWRTMGTSLLASTIAMGFNATESMVDYLIRLGAIYESGSRLQVSSLGLALLPELEASSVNDDVMVLGTGDSLGLPRIMGKIGAAGAALLADPYLKLEDAMHIAMSTGVDRILISERSKERDRDAIRAAFSRLPTDRVVEVRVAGRELHDRFLISDDGSVTSIGGSLNGASKHVMVLHDLADSQNEIRKAYDKMWKNAELLVKTATAGGPVDDARSDGPNGDPPAEGAE